MARKLKACLVSVTLVLLTVYWLSGNEIGIQTNSSPVYYVHGSSTPSTSARNMSFNNHFHILTMLSVFNGKRWPKYNEFTDQDLVDRDKEYLATLRANLENKVVKEVHLFYMEDDDLKLVKSQNFSALNKLRPVKWHRRLHMADFFLYASKNLVNKSVIAINGDILIGKGFDLIDTERLRDERVMFSLTRHNIIRDGKRCTPLNLCTESYYRASHDTHVFRLAEPLNETIILDKLDYPINMWGAENAMHWTFKNVLNFTVRNPCRVLVTHHNHCSKVHGPSLEKVDEHKYSIYYLPNKGWTQKKVLQSYTPFENSLAYRKRKKSGFLAFFYSFLLRWT
ncbi:hypothetical protein EB796_006937 [Bugula neritina]|uniref:Uncharacterized protein n=1 Tax=Bugula neritina TaxID=10212 RepID=A0A7J7K9Z1_BUGNE|nr:hypothetical protein EB796_006937 [Bugula neritina]